MAKSEELADFPAVNDDRVGEEALLPTGTVTFLLSDVEGSTPMWEADREAAASAIARHYELLDAAIVLHGGVRPLEQGEGDSVVAVFTHISDTLGAALDMQRALSDEVCRAIDRSRPHGAAHGRGSTPERTGPAFGRP